MHVIAVCPWSARESSVIIDQGSMIPHYSPVARSLLLCFHMRYTYKELFLFIATLSSKTCNPIQSIGGSITIGIQTPLEKTTLRLTFIVINLNVLVWPRTREHG